MRICLRNVEFCLNAILPHDDWQSPSQKDTAEYLDMALACHAAVCGFKGLDFSRLQFVVTTCGTAIIRYLDLYRMIELIIVGETSARHFMA
jgi:hypothetical protein